jgi:hypothetical protein
MVNQLTVFVVAPVGSKQRLITRAGKTNVPVGPEPLRRVSVRLTQRLVEFSKCTLQSELFYRFRSGLITLVGDDVWYVP